MNLGFSAQTIALIRGALMLIAVLFEAGIIPTSVDGGGAKVAASLMVVAVSLAAGDKTTPEVKAAIAANRI